MRKMLTVLLISGSLAAGVSAAFANEGGSDYPATSPTASATVLVPANGTATVVSTGATQAHEHEGRN